MKKSHLVICLTFTFAMLLSTVTYADSLRVDSGGIRSIPGGVKELGLETMFLFHYESTTKPDTPDDSISNSDLRWIAGATFRYFVIKNLGISLNVNFFMNTHSNIVTETDEEIEHKSSDIGGIGFLMVNYYINLGRNFFIAPGIGGGGFIGTRTRPEPGSTVEKHESSLVGGNARVDLTLVYYISNKVCLRAGVDFVAWFGSDTLKVEADEEAPEGDSFMTTDAGLSIGFMYIF